MRIALIAPPFIPVPPVKYGGTELYICQLAEGLTDLGHDVVVYTNGESSIETEKRWLYERSRWPIHGEIYDNLQDLTHTAWAVRDAVESCDVVHLNNVPGLACSRFVATPFVYTIHHPHDPGLSEIYSFYPDVYYVTISEFQRRRERMPRMRAIHHGVDLRHYRLVERKQPYLCFLGRIAPMKGTHLAIEAAKKSGIPLKIAGEVQPIFQDYFDSEVAPHVDGSFIDYVGEVGLEEKNDLLGNSLAMLFPIEWEEPFGLVMIEAMACGTPVLALPGGAVEEVVSEGISGCICGSVDEMAQRAREAAATFRPAAVRRYVERRFSVERMVTRYDELYREIAAGRAPEDLDVPRAVA